jgi:hypothetical protein
MRDNLDELSKHFHLEVDKKHAGGSIWRCLHCGLLAHSVEDFLPCQSDFVPVRVWCNECRNRWTLRLELTEDERATLTPQ